MSSVSHNISKQKNWMRRKSKLIKQSPTAIEIEKVKYDPQRIEKRRRRARCCGR